MYFEDESRFRLFTKEGRMLTARVVKLICIFHQEYSFPWFFGAFSPITGNGFLMGFPYSPELNPAEKMWTKFRRAFTNKLFRYLDELSLFIENTAKEINTSIVTIN